MPDELDDSWLPTPKMNPGGSIEVRLPTESEWMLAGGRVKKEVHQTSGYNLRPDWREHMHSWLSKWQEKKGMPGKAPKVYVMAYNLMDSVESLGFKVHFLGVEKPGGVVGELERRYLGITSEQIKDCLGFIKPLLVDKPFTVSVTEFK